MTRRKRLLARLGAALAACLALLVVYGVMVEPRLILDEERHVVEIPGLPPSWAGTEVAVFSDLQVGMWLANEGMVARVVQRAAELSPDAVLLAGDFVYSTEPDVAAQVDRVVELLEPLLESGVPVFAVLGNHDYAVGAVDELVAALEGRGVAVLRNEAVRLERPPGDDAGGSGDGDALHVVGLGPARPGMTDVAAALRGVPAAAPRVVVMHNPTSFPELPAGSAPLALAGHTHCGQIALPGTPRWSYVALSEEEARVAEGFAPRGYGEPGNRLFVTCGIGFSALPVRINAAPQLAVFELVPPR